MNEKWGESEKRLSMALIISSKNENVEAVKILLNDLRVNPDTRSNMALQIASFKGYAEIVNLLLDFGKVKVNPSVGTLDIVIWNVLRMGHVKILQALLKDGRFNPSIMSL